eukprot:334374-Rhodomonas_salina.1
MPCSMFIHPEFVQLGLQDRPGPPRSDAASESLASTPHTADLNGVGVTASLRTQILRARSLHVSGVRRTEMAIVPMCSRGVWWRARAVCDSGVALGHARVELRARAGEKQSQVELSRGKLKDWGRLAAVS